MVDLLGITHFSCTVLNRIGRTNHYDSPQKICLNGQFYSWYFFDYIRKVYTALENNRKAKPLVSYMHFNTGHEMTGKRMINMDVGIAKFFTVWPCFQTLWLWFFRTMVTKWLHSVALKGEGESYLIQRSSWLSLMMLKRNWVQKGWKLW